MSAGFYHRSAIRHLVIVAAVNPTADALGPQGTLAWSTAVEQLHQVCKLEVTWGVSHHPHYLGRNSSAPDRPIPVHNGWPNPFVLGAGKFTNLGFLNNFNRVGFRLTRVVFTNSMLTTLDSRSS